MLTFNLKKQWFDKIKSGEKTHEYREVKPYWKKRLSKHLESFANNKTFNKLIKNDIVILPCCFKCGYPKFEEKDKILYGGIKSITIINGKNTDLAIDKDVYDIEFELIGEQHVCND
jgi:hypothetical protein